MYADFKSAHKKHKLWQRIVSVLACIVVFCTTYALILPAITMETSSDPNAVFCGIEAHTHSEECYDQNNTLICISSEHGHSLACYSNPTADAETDTHWKKIVSELKISGVWEHDLLNVALSQRNYHESDRNYVVSDDGSINGYTRYGDWSGNAYGDWNTAFVGWCLQYSGIGDQYIPYSDDSSEWMSLLEESGSLRGSEYDSEKGDIAFLDSDTDGVSDRVGIITDHSYNEKELSSLKVIEGDKNKAVAETEYSADAVIGYACLEPAYWQYLEDNGLSAPKKYTVPIYTDKYYSTLSDDNTLITLEGVLPIDAKPYAYPVDVSVNGLDVVCSYDISIWLNDGTLYEPSRYVTVKIEQDDIPSSSAVYYVPENGEPEKMASRPSDDGVSFDAGHFSVYAVVGTQKEIVGDLNEKPTSSASSGWIKKFIEDISEIRGKYFSDKATSNIETQFPGIVQDDGKLYTDKSVIYNGNDYYTFGKYGSDEFSVTLSALAQQYAQSYEVKDKSPADVVMILDVSGSMESIGTNNEKRIDVATEAINYFINKLMILHPENRVGIVVFANHSEVFLPLGRYYVGTGTPSYSDSETVPEYIVCNSGGCTYNNKAYSGISTNASIRKINTDGKGNYVSSSTITQKKFCDYGGTFTQSGIARAAEMFLGEKNLDYTATTGDVIRRMPVTLLLSDGEPTFCTENYNNVLNGNFHGNGVADSSDSNNPKGILGYYTILSANYYKQQITNHYQYKDKNGNVDSYFYSIGMGIYPTGIDTAASDSSISGDHYKRAVLNPSAEEIALLTNKNAINYTINAQMLYNLLGSNYSGNSVSISAYSYSATKVNGYQIIGTAKTPTASVPVIKNPYQDYAYADEGFFSDEYSKLELAEVMDTILVNIVNNETYVKSFIEKTSNIDFYDVIGDGMEVKDEFILRYNGLDYAMSLVSDSGSVKKYQYTGTDTVHAYFGSEKAEQLSGIYAEVITDSDGKQTVHWFIPAHLIPEIAYFRGMDDADYYQMYPVRLIYKVGLTEASKNAVSELKEGDAPLVFYTNAWNGSNATAHFPVDSGNPYYKDGISVSEPKDFNMTGTLENYYESSGTTTVTSIFGNNGKLSFEYQTVVPDTDGELTNFKVDKLWSDGNESHSEDSVTLELLADGMLYDSVTLNESNSWSYIWENIPKYYTNGEIIFYTVKETKVPGYRSEIGKPAEGSFVKGYSWTDISAFTAGDTVRIIANGKALANTTGSTLNAVAVDDGDETQHWILIASGNNFVLQNKSTGRYLYASRSGNYNYTYTVSASTSSNAWYLNNSALRSASYNNRYINMNTSSGTVSLSTSGTSLSLQAFRAMMMNGTTVTVTNTKLEAADTTELTVKKQWLNADGSADTTVTHDNITVTLYADGDKYLTVTLSAASDWQTTIYDLPIAWSVSPNTPINWTFEESEVAGYHGVFGEIQKNTVTNTVFTTTNAFTNGEIFWITDNNGNALTASGTSLSSSKRNENNTYQQWKAEINNGYYYLKNVGTNTYLYLTRSGRNYSLALNNSPQQWEYRGNTLRNRSYTGYYLTLSASNAGIGTSGTSVTIGQYENETTNIWDVSLTNRFGIQLPSTGGHALFIYILCITLIMSGCSIYFILHRKKTKGRRISQ